MKDNMNQDKKIVDDLFITHISLDDKISLESILLEEYKYASTTAYQAIEDRARLINLYFILLSVFATGMSAIYQLSGPPCSYSQLLAIFLLLIAASLSFTFFINIIRIRRPLGKVLYV